jgi:hypothetical protein
MNGITVKTFPAPPVDAREVLRYAGHRGEITEELRRLLASCIEESEAALQYRVVYGALSLPDPLLITAADRLAGCHRAIVFAATVGVGIDRLIARYSRVQPAKALLLDALGSERVEALCDAFCNSLAMESGAFTPRFSPGYGAVPLALQRELIAVLDAPRRIGLTLNESLLMSPAKSVTAIVGVYKENV